MQSFTGRVASLGFFLLFTISSSLLAAQQPWDAAPFTGEPKAMLAAAAKVPAGEAGSVVLLDEARYNFDAQGHAVSTRHLVAYVIDDSAVDDWSTIEANWSPWFEEKPQIEARVISKDGSLHTLESKAITESAAEADLSIFSDNRIVRAPLPAVAAGSLLERVITYTHKTPIADAGLIDRFTFGSSVPVQEARLIIEAPSTLAVHVANHSSAKEEKSEANGRQRIAYELNALPAVESYEYFLPYDLSALPYVTFSTGRTWKEVAGRYSSIVETQIKDASLAAEVKEAVGAATERREVIARILASIQKNVRYAGVETGEGSMVPRAPREVLAHKYGDCKDKATLLVAMLRVAGIPAHVALLRSGSDLDVAADLPGLGEFNHAIVAVDGDPLLWIDPTDEFARAGELPAPDRGRNALIASESTTALVQTPVSEAAADRYIETRNFALVEEGKSTVVEVTEATGWQDSSLRRSYAAADRKTYREQIERYVDELYAAKKLTKIEATDAHDLNKQFQLTISAADASRGISEGGESAVAIFPASMLNWMPWPLRDYPDETSESDAAKTEAARKKRTHDFFFPELSLRETRYRIVPPPGFIARELPKNEVATFGTATLSQEYSSAPDGAVLATLRLDPGKRRLSPSEFEEIRKAVHEYKKVVIVGFDDAGKVKLDAGDIAGALTQYRAMSVAHPKEARHHSDIARALIAGGLGEPARAEARRAVAIEPNSAPAYRALGNVLEYDLLGRLHRKGFDRDGAIAAYRKAKELDSKDLNIRIELAKVYETGDDGELFGRNARTAEAIDEYKALSHDLANDTQESEVVVALARSGRFKELREFATHAKDSKQGVLGRIVATAALDGGAAALKEAGTLDVESRRDRLGTAGQLLLACRLYLPAADIFDNVAKGTAQAASIAPLVVILRKTHRPEELSIPENEPRGVVLHAMLDSSDPVMTRKKWMAADERDLGDESEVAMANASRLALRATNLPYTVLTDLGLAAMDFQQEGDEKSGYRIRARVPAGAAASLNEAFFVIREKGRYVVSASDKLPDSIGWSVLRFVDAGDVESARKWLNWTRENVTRGGGDDPLAGVLFAILWEKDKESATADEARVAAASLMPSKALAARAEAILLASRETITDQEKRNAVDMLLARIYVTRDDRPKALEVARRLFAAAPSSPTAFTLLSSMLVRNGLSAEAIKLAQARLEKMPKSIEAFRSLGSASLNASDYAAAEKYYHTVVDDLAPVHNDYNNVAWVALFDLHDFTKAIEDARRASGNGTSDPSALHTLAALYAESGKPIEARDALMKRLDLAGRLEPNSDDWYVLGRIAETYGLPDAARDAYKRVEKPKQSGGGTSYELAQRRLTAMSK
jgi:tetratricopeptide (TPR) repeat protein/transglutaminase-like putative cysteine protease